jgi:hypothetical protein
MLVIKPGYAGSEECCRKKFLTHEKKTLTRIADPIILSGQNLQALLGKPITHLRVYASMQGILAPIPYQIDERNALNKLALSDGPKPDQDDPEGVLDENDEIVFMAKDLGDQVLKEDWISGYEIGLEIEIQDSIVSKNGWAYIFYFANPPDPSSVDYVGYTINSTESMVSTWYYQVTSPPEKAYYTKLMITEAGGGNGMNLIKKVRVEGRARLDWYFLMGALKTFKRSEDDIRFKVSAYKDGPIRVILRGKPELELLWGFKLPSEEVDSIYYLSHLHYTNIIYSPVKVGRYCSQASLLTTFDFNENALGMKFYSAHNREGVILDGVSSPAEKKLVRNNNGWSVLTGKQGTLMAQIKRGPSLHRLKDMLYYEDSSGVSLDQKTRVVLRIGHLFDLTPLDKGTHQYQFYLYFLPSYRPGDEIPYLDITDNPPKGIVQNEVNLVNFQ